MYGTAMYKDGFYWAAPLIQLLNRVILVAPVNQASCLLLQPRINNRVLPTGVLPTVQVTDSVYSLHTTI